MHIKRLIKRFTQNFSWVERSVDIFKDQPTAFNLCVYNVSQTWTVGMVYVATNNTKKNVLWVPHYTPLRVSRNNLYSNKMSGHYSVYILYSERAWT